MSSISDKAITTTKCPMNTPMLSEVNAEYLNPNGYRAEFTEKRTVPMALDAELERLMKLPTFKIKRILNMIDMFPMFP